ncbi:hypothetical protein DNJ95_15690 [Stutzerimonas kirkiae]|uniref:Uncharacterized protein n=1 Tax=Stutzerimonas kirkiae TaxID=2211392 RepID=A0A4Q9QZ02_9GAMM|nr:hypothetical protein [Stutzerimonas kirkiae]TBU90626.1 hypothetical protein DNJ96_16485 [Stutzerimonas kirkiae]TBV00138.1 hypothetical protein DNJ95_15690 [Stutzerimonas kirkiae]TBV14083.1 hypothetical protein DNK01_10765 [Stutzerimonas kirkiae]
MTLPISSSTIVIRPAARSGTDASEVTGGTVQKGNASTSSSAGESLYQRLSALRKASRDMLSATSASESRKAVARQRIEQMKERIKMLKMLVASGLASKGMLREIRQLAQELGQAAQILKQVGSSSGGASLAVDDSPAVSGEALEPAALVSEDEAVAPYVSDGMQAIEAELREASDVDALAEDELTGTEAEASPDQAETQAQSAQQEANSLGAYLSNQDNSAARQRREDAELIKDVLNRLKSLLELLKSSVDLSDADSRKELEKINRLLSDTEDIATGLGGGVLGGLSLGGTISISA